MTRVEDLSEEESSQRVADWAAKQVCRRSRREVWSTPALPFRSIFPEPVVSAGK